MSINMWCKEHENIIVSISNLRSKIGYKTGITMEDAERKDSIYRELQSVDKPASEKDICTVLDGMYLELTNTELS